MPSGIILLQCNNYMACVALVLGNNYNTCWVHVHTYLLGVQNVSTADENGSGDDSGENSHRVLHDCIIYRLCWLDDEVCN